jgi:hypothetical protein
MHPVPTVDLHGFPPGYFLLRSLATGRLLDVAQDKATDGTPLVLWPEKDTSLVQREPIISFTRENVLIALPL